MNPNSRVVHSSLEDETEAILDQYGVGVDTHSRFIQVCCFVRSGTDVKRYEQEFTTDWTDLKHAREWILQVLKENDIEEEKFHFTIESTGTYHFPVVRAFDGIPRIVNPVLAGQTKRKTDVLDARLLAHHDITGLWNDSFIPDDEIEVLRCMLRTRRQWQQARIRTSNRITGLLLRFGHTLTSYAKLGSAYTNAILEDLISNKIPDAPGVCEHGLLPEAKQILDDLLVLWKTQSEQEKIWLDRANDYVKKLDFVTGDGEVVPGKDLMKTLQTVPGIGPSSALTWLAEVVWPGRFVNSKACAAYCGCDPTLKVSAGKVTSYARRGGNATLHKMLTLAASGLIARKNEPIGRWGYRLYKGKSKGGYRKAVGAVARRLCVALYYVHSKNEPFSYEGYQFWKTIEVPLIPLSEMNLGKFEKLLERMGLDTSQKVADAYFTTLATEKGVGEKCLEAVRRWIEEHKTGSLSVVKSSDARVRKSETRLYRKLRTES